MTIKVIPYLKHIWVIEILKHIRDEQALIRSLG